MKGVSFFDTGCLATAYGHTVCQGGQMDHFEDGMYEGQDAEEQENFDGDEYTNDQEDEGPEQEHDQDYEAYEEGFAAAETVSMTIPYGKTEPGKFYVNTADPGVNSFVSLLQSSLNVSMQIHSLTPQPNITNAAEFKYFRPPQQMYLDYVTKKVDSYVIGIKPFNVLLPKNGIVNFIISYKAQTPQPSTTNQPKQQQPKQQQH